MDRGKVCSCYMRHTSIKSSGEKHPAKKNQSALGGLDTDNTHAIFLQLFRAPPGPPIRPQILGFPQEDLIPAACL